MLYFRHDGAGAGNAAQSGFDLLLLAYAVSAEPAGASFNLLSQQLQFLLAPFGIVKVI